MSPFRMAGTPGAVAAEPTRASKAKRSTWRLLARAWAWWWVNTDANVAPFASKLLLIIAAATVPFVMLVDRQIDREERERAAAPCSAFANDPIDKVPLRCAPNAGCIR